MCYFGRVILVCYVFRVDIFFVFFIEEYEWVIVMLKKNFFLIESFGLVFVNEGLLSVLKCIY